MKRILFVCLGNICRSPLAEGIARHLCNSEGYDFLVDSAGTSGWHKGEPPCEHSIAVAAQFGIDISTLRARTVSPDDISLFDYVIAMDEENMKSLKRMGFFEVKKLGEFGGLNGADIPDPYFFKGFEGFEKVYTMIYRGVEDLLERIANGTL